MLRVTIILLLSCLCSLSIWSQELISDVENITRAYFQTSRGFISYDGSEYLVERGESETIISILDNGDLNHLHSIPSRPNDGDLVDIKDYRYSNSGLLLNGELLYEIYDYNIFIINFITGEIIRDIDLCEYDIKMGENFTFFDERILFSGDRIGEKSFFIYDLTNDQLQTIEWTTDEEVYHADHWLYTVEPGNKMIKGYNVKTGLFDLELNIEDGVQSVDIQYNLLKPNLKIVTLINEILEIEQNEILYRCSCFKNTEIELFRTYFRNGIIYASLRDNDEKYVVAKDILTCEDEMSFNSLIGESIVFLDNKALDERYLLLVSPGYYNSLGEIYLLDVQKNKYWNLNMPVDYLYAYQSLAFGNTLYINGFDDMHWGGIRHQTFAIDLDEKSFFQIHKMPSTLVFDVILGEKREDNLINFVTRHNYPGTQHLLEYNIADDTLTLNVDFDIINRGVNRIRRSIEVGEKYYYVDDLGVYVMSGDEVKFLIEGSAHMPLVENEGIVSGMIRNEEKLYLMQINSNDDSWDTIHFESFNYLDTDNEATNHAIFHFSNYPLGDGYFHLETKEFVNIEDLLGDKIISILAVSDEMALIKYDPYGDYSYHLLNTETRTLNKLIATDDYDYATSDGNGGFYLIEGSGDVKLRKIAHVDKNCNFLDETPIVYSRPYYDRYFESGDNYLICPLPGDNEMHFFMVKDMEIKLKSIPYEDTKYYKHPFIRYGKERVVISNFVNGIEKVTTMGIDEGKYIMTEVGSNQKLLEALVSNNRIALFLHEKLENKLRINIYDFESRQQVSSTLHDISKDLNTEVKMLGKISDEISLFSHDDGMHGNETFIFDIKSGTFSLLADISAGHLNGSPTYFVEMGEYVYFTSFTVDRSRQWFRVKSSDYSGINESIPATPMNIYPNPTSEYICFDEYISNYQIFDSQGAIALQNLVFSGKQIEVSSLPSGFYTLIANGTAANKLYGKFIIQR